MTDPLLNGFSNDLNVAVIGASGGIGHAFVDHLAVQNNVARIYALSRSAVAFDHNKVVSGALDLLDEDSIKAAADKIDGTLDIVIVASGFLHRNDIHPEKSLRDLNLDKFRAVFDVNAFGPALVAKHFTKLLPRERRSVFAALSARVGSIDDNVMGGWYAYRASKAALNMLLKTTAIEVARKYKQASILALHPGTVDTGLSEPFQDNVPDGKLFSPAYATECMLKVINDAGADKTGKLIAWDGEIIAY